MAISADYAAFPCCFHASVHAYCLVPIPLSLRLLPSEGGYPPMAPSYCRYIGTRRFVFTDTLDSMRLTLTKRHPRESSTKAVHGCGTDSLAGTHITYRILLRPSTISSSWKPLGMFKPCLPSESQRLSPLQFHTFQMHVFCLRKASRSDLISLQMHAEDLTHLSY